MCAADAAGAPAAGSSIRYAHSCLAPRCGPKYGHAEACRVAAGPSRAPRPSASSVRRLRCLTAIRPGTHCIAPKPAVDGDNWASGIEDEYFAYSPAASGTCRVSATQRDTIITVYNECGRWGARQPLAFQNSEVRPPSVSWACTQGSKYHLFWNAEYAPGRHSFFVSHSSAGGARPAASQQPSLPSLLAHARAGGGRPPLEEATQSGGPSRVATEDAAAGLLLAKCAIIGVLFVSLLCGARLASRRCRRSKYREVSATELQTAKYAVSSSYVNAMATARDPEADPLARHKAFIDMARGFGVSEDEIARAETSLADLQSRVQSVERPPEGAEGGDTASGGGFSLMPPVVPSAGSPRPILEAAGGD
mmetsp:Transcript_14638/g.48525  ORF Transcript_14638/g.48525 Transcript_14638/m.48525 type:complete len:364 (-) Transcript_14638:1178-2269(-)